MWVHTPATQSSSVQAFASWQSLGELHSSQPGIGVPVHEPIRPTTRLDLSGRPELLEVNSGVRPANIYDQLTDGEEVAA